MAGITGTVPLKMTSLRMRWSHWAKRERWEKGEKGDGKGSKQLIVNSDSCIIIMLDEAKIISFIWS